jgi:hypothetical protein
LTPALAQAIVDLFLKGASKKNQSSWQLEQQHVWNSPVSAKMILAITQGCQFLNSFWNRFRAFTASLGTGQSNHNTLSKNLKKRWLHYSASIGLVLQFWRSRVVWTQLRSILTCEGWLNLPRRNRR